MKIKTSFYFTAAALALAFLFLIPPQVNVAAEAVSVIKQDGSNYTTLAAWEADYHNKTVTFTDTVSAYDAANNESSQSASASATTQKYIPPSSGAPAIRYASAKNGPVSGWEGSATKGAAITIWADNIGVSRGNNTLTVCGVTLNKNSDFAEWGTNTKPITAKNTRRITFWLNSSMNGSGGICTTINGVKSNVYPFTCDTTGNIRFVDYQNGSDSKSGKTSATTWKTLNYAANQMKPGDFLYLKGGTYSEPRFNIGYWEVATDWYPGTDAERITMTSYPGEEAIVSTEIGARSSYWTFTNITFRGLAGSNLYEPLSLGDRNGFRVNSLHGIPEGISSIGNEFTGTMWHTMDAYGNNIIIQGNYIKFTPAPNTKNGSAYSLYVCSGTNRVIKDNEIHGGAKWLIHYYDEKRTGTEVYKEVSGVIEGNWFDATNNGGIGLRGAIILEVVNNGNPPVTIKMKKMIIRNNIFFTRDAGLIDGWAMVFMRQNARNIKIYNNTFYNINNKAIWVNHSSAENIDIKNNIFDNINNYDIDAYYWNGSLRNVTVDNNLYDNTPNLKNITDSGSVVGDPQFVNASGSDFHLQSTSPAIDSGTSAVSALVTEDYDHNPRPMDGNKNGTAEYDIGAYEYTGAYIPPSDTTSPQISSIQVSNTTSNSATISWTTDEPADTQIEYGLTTIYGTATNLNQTLTTSHSQTITRLSPATAYHFRVKSSDSSFNTSVSKDSTFTTGGGGGYYYDTIPPARPQDIKAQRADKQITLTRENPKDNDFVRVKVLRTKTEGDPQTCPSSHNDKKPALIIMTNLKNKPIWAKQPAQADTQSPISLNMALPPPNDWVR